MKAKFKQFFSIFSNESVRYYFLAFLICLIVILILDFFIADEERGKGILVEAHGMLMDILVLGVFLAIYDHFREKRNKIERYKKEIDDFRGWKSEEAKYRIIGNVKRLGKEGVTNINLCYCFLSEAQFHDIELQESDLSCAILYKVMLHRANLRKSIFRKSDLQSALIVQSFLEEADLRFSNLQCAEISDTNLKNANLREANLQDANLSMSNLQGVNLVRARFLNTKLFMLKSLDLAKVHTLNWFQHLRENSVEGIDEIESQYFIDSTPFSGENNEIYYLVRKKEIIPESPVSNL